MAASQLRYLAFGFVCGLCSFFSYLLEASAPTPLPISVSHFFIILSVIAAGPEAGLIAFSVGCLPSTLLGDTSLRIVVQATTIVIALALHQRSSREIPGHFVALLVWMLVLIPLRLAVPDALWHEGVSVYYFGLQSLVDMFLVAAATALLFIPWVWNNLMISPSLPNRERLVSAVCGATLPLVVLCGMLMSPHLGNGIDPSMGDFGLLLVVTAIVSGLSVFGAKWLEKTTEELSLHHTRSRLTGSFHSEQAPLAQVQGAQTTSSPMEDDEDSSPINTPGVCAVGDNGSIILMNQMFRQLVQVDEENPIGKRFLELEMNSQIQGRLYDLLQGTAEGESKGGEITVNELPNSLRFFSASVEPHFVGVDQGAKLITLQEITRRRTVDTHYFELQKLKNLGSVVGSISHAFNNSLTAIIGQASFALRSSDEHAQQLALEEIRTQAQKSGDLVWKLLDFVRGKPSAFRPVSITTTFQEKSDLLQKLVGENYQLTLHGSDHPLWIDGDQNLLLNALTELVTNAKEAYREQTGEIEIFMSTEEVDEDIAQFHPGATAGSFARLTVKDTGCGMSSEMVSQAFAPLTTTGKQSEKSGLGLSIVYAIVRAHDGFLNVESFPEKGTTVSVYLPLRADQNLSSAELLEAEDSLLIEDETTQPSGAQILVVEDEPNIREVIGKMLGVLGYQVSTCANAKEATAKCKETDYDLLLIDYIMPHTGGIDLISQLQKEACESRFLLMTGCGMTKAEKDGENIPLLAKPFDIDTLSQSIAEALN